MNVLRAESYLKTCGHLDSAKLAEVYDDDEMLRLALATLIPGFEYPDHSHLTVGQIRARYFKNPLPLLRG